MKMGWVNKILTKKKSGCCFFFDKFYGKIKVKKQKAKARIFPTFAFLLFIF
jgi:hypothetical protein